MILSGYFRIIILTWKIPKTINHLYPTITYFPNLSSHKFSEHISLLHSSCSHLSSHTGLLAVSGTDSRHAHGSGSLPMILHRTLFPYYLCNLLPNYFRSSSNVVSQWVLPSTSYLKGIPIPAILPPFSAFCLLHSTFHHLAKYAFYSYIF